MASLAPEDMISNNQPARAEGDLLKLRRWNSCTICNAIEQVSHADPLSLTNLEAVTDFMPEMGPMIGYAVTVVITGDDPQVKRDHPDNFSLYREYLASRPFPKIVIVQDLNKPKCYGSIWGEVGANVARSLGCVGTITDGAIRDLDEMKAVGFKSMASRLSVSHAHTWPIRWDCEIEVFGTRIKPGQLIHADKHGFVIIPEDAYPRVLEAARFMDDNECDTVIAAARAQREGCLPETLRHMADAANRFRRNTQQKFS